MRTAYRIVSGALTLLLAAGCLQAEDSVHHKAAPAKSAAKTAKPVAKSAHPAAKAAKPSAKSAKVYKKRRYVRHVRRVRGQKAIDSNRVREIQAALAREHYLKTAPNGKWDAPTQSAMRRYQADQGWQNKSVPDSRALIRLGLGPDQEHLLNPESAMTSQPFTQREEAGAAAVSPALPAASTHSTPVSALPEATPSK